jgi:hypothetical protein
MDPDGPKGHFAFNFPIQPDDGDKDTLFQLDYHMPYSANKYAFHAQVTLPADNFAVLMPKSMSFTPAKDGAFKSVPEDPAVQTFILKNPAPDASIDFTISGTGSIPREQQGTPGAQQPAGMGAQGASGAAPDASAGNGGQPGGGIGTPIGTPDPLSKYKWWILGGIGLLLAAAAAFLLRKPAGAAVAGVPVAGAQPALDTGAVAAAYPAFASPAAKNSQLLNVLKEEMFALESEKINGTIAADEYAKVKDALDTVLKRALNRK